MTVFQLLKVDYQHPRRYPRFSVYCPTPLFIASSLDLAEAYLRNYVSDFRNQVDVYAFYLRELPVDVPAAGYECISERVYSPDGLLIDRRMFSSVREIPGVFEGRDPEEIRFKPGDIVEVLDSDEVHLAFVAGVPTSREEAKRINGDGIIQLDVTDDTYMVFDGPGYCFHQHIDALRVFAPRFKIPGPIRRSIEKSSQTWLRRLGY
ncbi:MAG: hypothetical protein J6W59_03310 [Bacteroidales bacterium]|nr:hypothetical protein [Bacteroidales bacterium]